MPFDLMGGAVRLPHCHLGISRLTHPVAQEGGRNSGRDSFSKDSKPSSKPKLEKPSSGTADPLDWLLRKAPSDAGRGGSSSAGLQPKQKVTAENVTAAAQKVPQGNGDWICGNCSEELPGSFNFCSRARITI